MNKNAILIIILLIIVIILVFSWKFYSPLLGSTFGEIFKKEDQNNKPQEQSILDRIEAAILLKLKNK